MRFLIFIFLSANFVATGSAQTAFKTPPKSDLRLRLDQNAPRWLKQYDVPSVAVAYIENGEPAWTAVYGEQSPGVPATLKTLYNVASLTKPISAEIILRLASAGKLSLDEPLSTHWVDPDVRDNAWQKLLTPRLCLSHQTGFSNWRFQTNDGTTSALLARDALTLETTEARAVFEAADDALAAKLGVHFVEPRQI